jgi:hypothetical protein
MLSLMATVHDFHVIGYSVDVDARTIVLRTEWRYAGQPLWKVDAVFEGVEAYAFRDDPLGTVLFDIEQVDPTQELEAHWKELDESHHRSGAPRFWRQAPDETRISFAKLLAQGAKWFDVSSSIGMNGWVFCQSLALREK